MVVAAPSVIAPSTGLLQTVRPIVHGSSPDESRWEGGLTFLPNGCVGSHVTSNVCSEGPHDSKPADSLGAVVEYDPFLVWTGAACTTLQGVGRNELEPRMRTALELSQGESIEHELWTGEQAVADGSPNLYLAGGSPNFVDLSPLASDVSPGAYGLAALQEHLAHCSPSGRGMIHATVNVVTMWQSKQVVRIENGLILDLYGNWIVAGTGYDGSDPDGNVDATGETAYAYATGLVDVHLSPIISLPDPDRLVDAIRRSDNTVEWRAERVAAAVFDGCCHAGVRVGICETTCQPSGS
jgi:hypothetical protein